MSRSSALRPRHGLFIAGLVVCEAMPPRADYDATTYLESTYADAHKQAYLLVRNEALTELLAELRGDRSRLRNRFYRQLRELLHGARMGRF